RGKASARRRGTDIVDGRDGGGRASQSVCADRRVRPPRAGPRQWQGRRSFRHIGPCRRQARVRGEGVRALRNGSGSAAVLEAHGAVSPSFRLPPLTRQCQARRGSAANAAVAAPVPILSVELKPLRVNGVSPGVIDTPWWDAVPEERKQAMFKEFAAKT